MSIRKNNTVKTNECTSYFLDLDRLVKDEEGKNNVKIEEICGNENIEICIQSPASEQKAS